MQSSGLINEGGQAKFKYEFKFGNDEIIYKYSRFANTELCDEELSINGNIIFKCDFKNNKFDFKDLNRMNTNLYFMHDNHALSFLRWFVYNTTFSDDSVLIQLFEYVRKMDLITVGHDLLCSNRNFFEDLKKSNLFTKL